MKIYEIKKSKFISYLLDINNKEEAKNILDSLWAEHKKARHIVYAYICQDNDGNKINGFSDDREPKGVAGLPIYLYLEKKNLINKGIFIVRYFGGIKLGKSGLLRAYLNSAKLLFDEKK
ncbi:putative YigZ family protein [Metamycoplasma subdolum]|uniref:Putative YigZ family protein n=1 Tax=Metamycoplasma subdolum TaxID=92407 RepID=A0A3L9ZZ72_9BACT|nr:YigZ family protein [Metamycoplasma subdolum]RMA77434.1 putative YigZ family protein [Metamycoplasma subdolum]WPB50337.1 YigZ family protein [Metamycoplasma subdolum]